MHRIIPDTYSLKIQKKILKLKLESTLRVIHNKNNNYILNYNHKFYGHNTEYSYYFYYVSQIVWILILTLGFISIFSKDRYRVLFYISYIGIFLFVSIFESLSRYLFVNVPIFIIVSIYGIDSIDKLIRLCKRKLKIL